MCLKQQIKRVNPGRLKIGAILRGDINCNNVKVLGQIQSRAINSNGETTGIRPLTH